MKKMLLSLAMIGGLQSVSAQANILYTFDVDASDWALTDGQLDYVATGGNGSGFINTIDTNSNDMVLHAPVAALGNWTQYLGGVLSFDALNVSRQDADWNGFGEITITSGSNSITLDIQPNLNQPPNDGQWHTFSTELSATVWGNQLVSILSNVTSLTIKTEDHVSGSFPDEQVGFDNFSVTAVPEPSSYALLLAGLGVLGVVRKRRQS